MRIVILPGGGRVEVDEEEVSYPADPDFEELMGLQAIDALPPGRYFPDADLVIARALAEAHGGEVEDESDNDEEEPLPEGSVY